MSPIGPLTVCGHESKCAAFIWVHAFFFQEIVNLAGGKVREGELKSVFPLQVIERYFLLALPCGGGMECIPSSGAIL